MLLEFERLCQDRSAALCHCDHFTVLSTGSAKNLFDFRIESLIGDDVRGNGACTGNGPAEEGTYALGVWSQRAEEHDNMGQSKRYCIDCEAQESPNDIAPGRK